MMRLSPAFLLLCLVACGSEETPDQTLGPAPEPGQMSLQWTISKDGAAISCPDANATDVHVVATTEEREVVMSLSCFGGLGTVGPMDDDRFNVEVWLVNGEGEILDRVDFGEVEVPAGRIHALGQIDFTL
jgi:hypothetical protein